MLGGYNINVATTSLPQNVASGFDNAFDGLKFTGAEYSMIAYLGKQQVNGYNHAFLALQKLVTKDDVKNIVLVILNEKPGDIGGNTFSIVEIRRLLADGSNLMGGINVAPTTKIPEDAMKVYNERFGTSFGATTKPIALLATQVVNGVAYYFATESTLVTGPVGDIDVMANIPDHVNINIVKIFSNYHDIETKLVLEGTKENPLKEATVDNDNTRLSSHLTSGARASYSFNW